MTDTLHVILGILAIALAVGVAALVIPYVYRSR